MARILFFDTEITNDGKHLKDIGAVSEDGLSIHTPKRNAFASFASNFDYLCGHNIIAHDLKYVEAELQRTGRNYKYIDTLCLSPLLFPSRPYHHLLKDDKLQTGELNNPVNDSIKAKDLFFDEFTAFNRLDKRLQRIYCSLLYNRPEFTGFFEYLGMGPLPGVDISIRNEFRNQVCASADIRSFINESPIELAYCLALIRTGDKHTTIALWVARNYPKVHSIYNSLCNTPCRAGCPYCNAHFGIKQKLKEYFDYDDFRTYNDEPLQQNAVQAAVNGKSLLAVFPTGGGKSLTFQLPALIASETAHGLTVVISPLQSLMKDQVDNLNDKGIVDATTINGSLNPVERKDAIEMVESGVASILYISPESLRSSSIERLLKSRNVVRFIIDEAHCFSSWGQDFRVDYLYIGPFIKKLQKDKNLDKPIPVSCFTATAKQKVISDIRGYFREYCGLELELFTTNAARTNLRYEVLFCEDEEKKYSTLRGIILAKNCPTIVYVSRTKKTLELAMRLQCDGIPAVHYHGQMESVEKKANQEAFMNGLVTVVVATTAFGMGIDKDDVGLVIHYNISTSLEDYVQEAGRAGRNLETDADCCILFNNSDLDKHFQYLNEMKLSLSEIQQIWSTVKRLTKTCKKFTKTPLEIAREAGWDDTFPLIETKVKSSISALEQAGYLKRRKNVPHIYANGLAVHNLSEAAEGIRNLPSFTDKDKQLAIEIMNFLISKRSHARARTDDDESRIDYIADRLGRSTREVMSMVIRLREKGFLDDSLDMSAYIDHSSKTNRALNILERVMSVERYLIDTLPEYSVVTLKELNSHAIAEGIRNSSTKHIKTLILFWMRQKYIKKAVVGEDKLFPIEKLERFSSIRDEFAQRINVARFIVNYLYHKPAPTHNFTEITFSILELQKAYNSQHSLLSDLKKASSSDIINALIYLKNIGAMVLDGGFLVIYNAIQVERLEMDNHIRYKKDDYKDLEEFYDQRRFQIHTIGEYARIMAEDYNAAMEFMSDYFAMDYMLFIRKYFKGERSKEIKRSITPERYNKLFESLSSSQRRIIDDDKSQHIVVAAGPGSGKTKVLVHKLASLLLLEDVKSEQLLMLTFSRAAATEFKQRLIGLIGDAAFYVEIKTFHSYCFNLLGQIGNITESEYVVPRATAMIKNGEVDAGKITKTVLVLDEAQDMNRHEFALVEALMEFNEDMRVIAVGDDDQNIYEFRDSNSKHLRSLITEYDAVQYEMLENYRSDRRIVALANEYASTIETRMKRDPIVSISSNHGFVGLTKYSTSNLVVPTLDLIKKTYKGGTCCVMTATNDEALLMTGVLNKSGIKARLIQSNDGFDLSNLYELRCFIEMLGDPQTQPVIPKDVWDNTLKAFGQRFKRSSCLPECIRLLSAFDVINKEKYYSDFIEYLRESKLEDLTAESEDTILVSTIHKTKGREFDTVYMMLNNYRVKDDSARHVIYVGITRARKALYINCNTNIFDNCFASGFIKRIDRNKYPESEEALLQLTHKGVNLGYFKYLNRESYDLYCGQLLIEKNGDMLADIDNGRKTVLKLSKGSMETINSLRKRGFNIYKSEIRFLVYWKGKNEEQEVLCVLPNIYLRKGDRLNPEELRPEQQRITQQRKKDIDLDTKKRVDSLKDAQAPNKELDNITDYIKPSDVLSKEEMALYGILRTLREDLAKELHSAEFVVATHNTMIDLCLKKPVTIEALSRVYGFGHKKVARFGDRFIDTIRDFIEKHPDCDTGKTNEFGTSSPAKKAALKRSAFHLSPEEMQKVKISRKPLPITDIARNLNSVADNTKVKKLSYKTILQWLIDQGYIVEEEYKEGKLRRPTVKGEEAGIMLDERLSSTRGVYYVTLYLPEAQRLILENVNEMSW